MGNMQVICTIKADARAYGFSSSIFGPIKASLMSPGFQVITTYRISHRLWCWGGIFRAAAILLATHLWKTSSCQIAPAAIIEGGVIFPHPVGIVIGEGAIVHSGVKVFQNVTLGKLCYGAEDGYPEIGKNSILYTGALVVGTVKIAPQSVVKAYEIVTPNSRDRQR